MTAEEKQEALMAKVLNGEPFPGWGEYNRMYAEYMAKKHLEELQRGRQRDCCHSTTRIEFGRLVCTHCGKRGD